MQFAVCIPRSGTSGAWREITDHLVRVEAIHHQMPLSGLGVSRDHRFEMGQIVSLGAGIANTPFDNAIAGDINNRIRRKRDWDL
ncbi:MAG: hypothetical protein ACFBSF_05800 [Leptolyngbyaceae cyanobacterium]